MKVFLEVFFNGRIGGCCDWLTASLFCSKIVENLCGEGVEANHLKEVDIPSQETEVDLGFLALGTETDRPFLLVYDVQQFFLVLVPELGVGKQGVAHNCIQEEEGRPPVGLRREAA